MNSNFIRKIIINASLYRKTKTNYYKFITFDDIYE